MSNENETPTPLTDAIHYDCCVSNAPTGDQYRVMHGHARILERQLAEARKDTETLDWLLGSDWICIDHEYWNPSKEQYQTKLLESRQAIDNAMKEDER